MICDNTRGLGGRRREDEMGARGGRAPAAPFAGPPVPLWWHYGCAIWHAEGAGASGAIHWTPCDRRMLVT